MNAWISSASCARRKKAASAGAVRVKRGRVWQSRRMLKERIEEELSKAMRSRDALRLSVFRMLSAALRNREIEKRTKSGEGHDIPLTEDEILQVVRSEQKKRKDAIEGYEKGGRASSAEQERSEAEILSGLLPAELSDEEVAVIVAECAASLGVPSPKEFGKLMSLVMGRVGGRASGERVSSAVRRALGM